MFFVDKILFAAFAALPILILIYFLHRKVERVEISSLIFWENQLKSVKSGTGIKAIPLPLRFFLEALMIILLVLAAAGPFLVTSEKVPALTVILDDSFSMRSGQPDAPRKQAEKKLLDMLSSGPTRKVQFIIAGPTPRLLDEADSNSGKVKHLLEKWQCRQASSDIDAALLFARRTFGNKNDILILTDRKPDFKELPPGMNWFSFGRPRQNIALINASRSFFPQGDKCLIEVVNYSVKNESIPVRIEFPGTEEKPVIYMLEAASGGKVKHIFRLPAGAGAIKVSLPEDQLKYDNSVTLLPEKRKLLRIELSSLNPEVKKLLDKTLKLTGMVRFSKVDPHLIFSGVEPKEIQNGDAWYAIFLIPAKSQAYIGPYTVDRQHPLCYGLHPDGVIWGADAGPLPGKALILAGNTPLVSDYLFRSDRHMVFFKFAPKNSSLQESPNFPAMIFNLVDWRLKALPGLAKSNYRAGEKVIFNAPPGISRVTVNGPDNKNYSLGLADRTCTLDVFLPGDYLLEAGKNKYEFRVNPLSADESDIRNCGSVMLEGEKNENIYRKRFMNAGWIFLLATLAISALHLYLTRRRSA